MAPKTSSPLHRQVDTLKLTQGATLPHWKLQNTVTHLLPQPQDHAMHRCPVRPSAVYDLCTKFLPGQGTMLLPQPLHIPYLWSDTLTPK
jgi:hypothetical protein